MIISGELCPLRHDAPYIWNFSISSSSLRQGQRNTDVFRRKTNQREYTIVKDGNLAYRQPLPQQGSASSDPKKYKYKKCKEHSMHATHDVIVIGAGFAGLYMLHSCAAGYTALILEGSFHWRHMVWNKYPGARCDIERIGIIRLR